MPTPLARRAELSVRMKRASRASNLWESRWKPRKAYYIDENIRNLEEGKRWGLGLVSFEKARMLSIKKLKGQLPQKGLT